MPLLIYLINALGRAAGYYRPPAYYLLDVVCAVLYLRALPKQWRPAAWANLALVALYGFDTCVAYLPIPTFIIHLFPGLSAAFVAAAWFCFMECRDMKERLATAFIVPLVVYNLVDELVGDLSYNPAEYAVSVLLLFFSFAAKIRAHFAK